MLKYGFTENVDFTSVKIFTLVNQGAKKPITENVEGTDFVGCKVFNTLAIQYLDEYYISIDMAKEICMIQHSEIGRKLRQYFLNFKSASQGLLQRTRQTFENFKSEVGVKGLLQRTRQDFSAKSGVFC